MLRERSPGRWPPCVGGFFPSRFVMMNAGGAAQQKGGIGCCFGGNLA